jgi:hypothetical protein
MSLLSDPLVIIIIAIVVFSILYYYRSTILLHQKLKPAEIPRKEREISRGIPEVTECPRCDRVMEEGYLIGPGGIFWSKIAPLFDVMGGARWRYGFGVPFGSQPLGSTVLRGPGRVPYLKAYRCSSCGLVYIDLSRQGLGE